MDGVRHSGDGIFRLVYRSHNRIPAAERRAALGLLFTDARGRNKRMGVTGALLLSDDWFVQTLEGDERMVRTLYDRIEVDTRHEAVELLEQGPVPDRVFARWAMAKVSDDEGEPDLPLLAQTRGIAVAAPRGPSTPQQDDVLALMRDAGRGVAVRPG